MRRHIKHKWIEVDTPNFITNLYAIADSVERCSVTECQVHRYKIVNDYLYMNRTPRENKETFDILRRLKQATFGAFT